MAQTKYRLATVAIILLATHHTANGVPPVAAIISTLILLLVRGLTGA